MAEFTRLDPQVLEGIAVFTDASWGGQESQQRRSCTGFVITWRGCAVKMISKLQVPVSLSSCESEVIALVQAAQEACGVRQLLHFLSTAGADDPRSLAEVSLDSPCPPGPPITLITDSASAKQVLQGRWP